MARVTKTGEIVRTFEPIMKCEARWYYDEGRTVFVCVRNDSPNDGSTQMKREWNESPCAFDLFLHNWSAYHGEPQPRFFIEERA